MRTSSASFFILRDSSPSGHIGPGHASLTCSGTTDGQSAGMVKADPLEVDQMVLQKKLLSGIAWKWTSVRVTLPLLSLVLCSQVQAQGVESHGPSSTVPIPYACIGTHAADCIADAAIAIVNSAVATEGSTIYDDLAGDLAKTLAAIGRVNEGAEFARPIVDKTRRELTFWGMSVEVAEDGDLDRAAALIDEGVLESYRGEALQGLASRHFDQDDEVGAIEVIAQIENSSGRAMAIMTRATDLAKAGREADARRAKAEALDIVTPENRGWLMLQGVAVLVWLGEDDAARQELHQLAGRVRDDALRNMATAYSDLRKFDRAQEYLTLISSPMIRGFASANVADNAVQAGDLGFALALAIEAPDHQSRNTVLLAVARALVAQRDLDGAKSVYGDAMAYALADESDARGFVLSGVVSAMAWEGFEEESRALLGYLGSETEREFVLKNIAVWHARSGDLASALSTTEEIGADYVRFLTLLDIANETDTLVRKLR